jgi:ArsR family transcriptional regulator
MDDTSCCSGPDTLDDETLARTCKALGHPLRIRILRLLIERRECIVGDLVDELPVAQSTVSQHLKVLKEAGLVLGEVDGPRRCYCVDRARLAQVRELLGGL